MTVPAEVTRITLGRANKIRTERAEYKRKVKKNEINPVDAILECDVGLPAFDLICSIYQFGRFRASKVFADLKLNAGTLILGEPSQTQKLDGWRDATQRERKLLAAHIETMLANRESWTWNRKAA